jgi:predicted TIM-barrel fold metal-dependent hydrolase
MYRSTGPDELRSIGEVEFANGVAAMSASRSFGPTMACAAIVGAADLRLGERVGAVLTAHVNAGGGRYRGIRGEPLADDADFRAGFQWLGRLGLSFDCLTFGSQLDKLGGLADAFPDTQIVVNHLGAPDMADGFSAWRASMRALSGRPNIAIKLGGLRVRAGTSDHLTSQQLAEEWRPYFETAIELFGAERCMFESDYPASAAVAAYPVLWNAFKLAVASASQAEKAALFSLTARRVYRLES